MKIVMQFVENDSQMSFNVTVTVTLTAVLQPK